MELQERISPENGVAFRRVYLFGKDYPHQFYLFRIPGHEYLRYVVTFAPKKGIPDTIDFEFSLLPPKRGDRERWENKTDVESRYIPKAGTYINVQYDDPRIAPIVFSTVARILLWWLKRNPQISGIIFTGENPGTSRPKLYGRFAQHLADIMGWKVDVLNKLDHTKFSVYAPDSPLEARVNKVRMGESLSSVRLKPAEGGVTYRGPRNEFFLRWETKHYDFIRAYTRVPDYESSSVKMVGEFRFYVLGSTLYPDDGSDGDYYYDEENEDSDDTVVAIHVDPEFRRQGLATAMVRYAMQVTNAKHFERSDEETEEGSQFFPTLNEESEDNGNPEEELDEGSRFHRMGF